VLKVRPTDLVGTTGYLCEGDPSAQVADRITAHDLECRAKLWLLLFDRVFISAGHMVCSDLTFDWLTRETKAVSTLAGGGALMPSLRDDRADMQDYVAQHSLGSESWWGGKSRQNLLRRAGTLDQLFSEAISWSPAAEARWFRDSLVAALESYASPIRRSLAGASQRNIRGLLTALRSCDGLDRSALHHIASQHCGERAATICRYGDVLYHVSGALEKLSYPLLPRGEGALCRATAQQEARSIKPQCDTWHGVLGALALSEQTLSDAPLTVIAQMREERFAKEARVTWSRILGSTTQRSMSNLSLASWAQQERAVLQTFTTEVYKQLTTYKKRTTYRDRLEATAWGVGIVGTVAALPLVGPAAVGVGVSAGLVGLLTGKPLLDLAFNRSGTELVVLSSRLRGF
jgi:hypothetical protein